MHRYYPIGAGLLLALAFPKFNLWWLAWVALVPFFIALGRAEKPRAAARAALWFGLPFFGCTLFWVTSLSRYVGLWAYVAWLCLIVFQTLFVVLFAACSYRLASFWKAVLWVLLVELARAWGPFGVTAGGIGYSQVQLLPLIQIASFFQVYGVSFLVVFFNAALAEVIREPRRSVAGFLPVGLAIVLVLFAWAYGETTINNSKLLANNLPRIALLQPNIDQFDRMNQSLVNRNFALQAEMAREAAKSKPEIIVWPETALYAYILRDPMIFQRFRELARETGAWQVVGTAHYDYDGLIYNSIVAITPSGEVTARYDKENLVPFGEYLPFRPLLLPLLRSTGYFSQDFAPNPRAVPLPVAGRQVAAGVCFESTFPAAMKKRVKPDSAYILILTNDAWFDDSAAPYIHYNCGIFRAIENRRWFVQCGNSGISAVIDPWGRAVKRTKVGSRELLLLGKTEPGL